MGAPYPGLDIWGCEHQDPMSCSWGCGGRGSPVSQFWGCGAHRSSVFKLWGCGGCGSPVSQLWFCCQWEPHVLPLRSLGCSLQTSTLPRLWLSMLPAQGVACWYCRTGLQHCLALPVPSLLQHPSQHGRCRMGCPHHLSLCSTSPSLWLWVADG